MRSSNGGSNGRAEGPRKRGWGLEAGAVAAVVLAVVAVGCTATGGTDESVAEGAPSHPATTSSATSTGASEAPFAREHVSLVDVRTGQGTLLPATIRAVLSPFWPANFHASPNGTKLAFGTEDGIYVADVDGSHVWRLVGSSDVSGPSWSPRGGWLTFAEGPRVVVAHAQTGGGYVVARSESTVWHPNFSPDGRTILFTTTVDGKAELWTVPATGGRSSRLLRLPGRDGAAFGTYGPDGTIAFRRTSFDGSETTGLTDAKVWIVDAEGVRPRTLGGGPNAAMSQTDPRALWPAWSPDGRKVAVEPMYGWGIAVIDLDTGRVTRIGRGKNPTWLNEHTLIIERFGSA